MITDKEIDDIITAYNCVKSEMSGMWNREDIKSTLKEKGHEVEQEKSKLDELYDYIDKCIKLNKWHPGSLTSYIEQAIKEIQEQHKKEIEDIKSNNYVDELCGKMKNKSLNRIIPQHLIDEIKSIQGLIQAGCKLGYDEVQSLQELLNIIGK